MYCQLKYNTILESRKDVYINKISKRLIIFTFTVEVVYFENF